MNFSSLKCRSWPVLFAGMLITAVVSLSIHAVMLQVLNIPFPSVTIDAPISNFLTKNLLSVLALIYLCQLATPALQKSSWLARSAIFFVIWMGLSEELFRAAFMAGYCTNAYTYAFVSHLPTILSPLVMTLIVVRVAGLLDNFWKRAGAAVIISVFAKFVLVPVIAYAFKAPMEAIASLAPQGEWCELPYGPNVLIPAYLTYIEPTLACFAAAMLVWEQLPGRTLAKLCQFAVLVLLLKRLLFAPFVYMMYAHLPPLTALASMGQFALETLFLALGAGLTWSVSRQRQAV